MVTGTIRRIDTAGRVGIPSDVREALNIREGDHAVISVQGDTILIKKYKRLNLCAFCGAEDECDEYMNLNNKLICPKCIKELVMNSEN